MNQEDRDKILDELIEDAKELGLYDYELTLLPNKETK